MDAAICNCCFSDITSDVTFPLVLKCVPKKEFKSNKICEEFPRGIQTIIVIAR